MVPSMSLLVRFCARWNVARLARWRLLIAPKTPSSAPVANERVGSSPGRMRHPCRRSIPRRLRRARDGGSTIARSPLPDRIEFVVPGADVPVVSADRVAHAGDGQQVASPVNQHRDQQQFGWFMGHLMEDGGDLCRFAHPAKSDDAPGMRAPEKPAAGESPTTDTVWETMPVTAGRRSRPRRSCRRRRFASSWDVDRVDHHVHAEFAAALRDDQAAFEEFRPNVCG